MTTIEQGLHVNVALNYARLVLADKTDRAINTQARADEATRREAADPESAGAYLRGLPDRVAADMAWADFGQWHQLVEMMEQEAGYWLKRTGSL